jgi:hypothetical protein
MKEIKVRELVDVLKIQNRIMKSLAIALSGVGGGRGREMVGPSNQCTI